MSQKTIAPKAPPALKPVEILADFYHHVEKLYGAEMADVYAKLRSEEATFFITKGYSSVESSAVLTNSF